jgi:TolA-binding protein
VDQSIKLTYENSSPNGMISSNSSTSGHESNGSNSADHTFDISNSSEDEKHVAATAPAGTTVLTYDVTGSKPHSDFVLAGSSSSTRVVSGDSCSSGVESSELTAIDSDGCGGGIVEVEDEQQLKTDSKVKMRQMQQQLEQLTSLVNQALMNRDLNQLASIVSSQYSLESALSSHQQQQQSAACVDTLNERTRVLKTDLLTIKKMQENLKHLFGDSMKGFMSQLNEKLKSVCLQELNEKIKLDMIVYKYKLDNCKIESELSELETVVDDLRASILKHKIHVSIDDVECYALALSQVSKQLVNLKSTFSHIKEQFKLQSAVSSSSSSSSTVSLGGSGVNNADSSSADSFDKTFENK